jgi:hypothetical protein
MRRSEPSLDRSLDLVAKRLRDDDSALAAKPLPRRWVDLLLQLDEREQRSKSLSCEGVTKP